MVALLALYYPGDYTVNGGRTLVNIPRLIVFLITVGGMLFVATAMLIGWWQHHPAIFTFILVAVGSLMAIIGIGWAGKENTIHEPE